ncbi:MAG: guanylate kinase [Planctomycetaceae bacterium]|nr:guanylate kinase [Planctomycetaceae bacterium]
MQDTIANGKLVIISGPSGVGKSTICKRLVEQLDAFVSISVTTRARAAAEENGRDYWFIGPDEFKKRLENNELLEWAEVFGNFYGTPKKPIEEALGQGRVVILEIDVQGARQVKRIFRDALTIFILPPRKEDLLKRMADRDRGEDAQNQRRRLETAAREIADAWQRYDHLVVNDRLEVAVQEIIELIQDSKKETV